METKDDKQKPISIAPTKQVKNMEDLKKWEKSEAYQEYLGFIQMIGEAISGKKIRDDKIEKSEAVLKTLEMLETLSQWADEIKLEEQQQRFGNQAFRTWHNRLKDQSEELLQTIVVKDNTEETNSIIQEVQVYLKDSFGNSTRIDYGTGHEMTFVMFLACLFHAGVYDVKRDACAVGLVVFGKYMNLVRKLQTTYRMEPAGSQGVWSLDDYQFVSFIWGAAQFTNGNDIVSPSSISDYEKAENMKDDYHFFACINYINQVKTGPFAEHSNQLWNVSGVQSWNKVYLGLIKMYRAEIICKFPVIQHTYFGSIFSLEPAKDQRGVAKLIDNQRPPPRPKFDPNMLGKMPPLLSKMPK